MIRIPEWAKLELSNPVFVIPAILVIFCLGSWFMLTSINQLVAASRDNMTVDIYAHSGPFTACGQVNGMPVGYGTVIEGWSHYALCWMDGKLIEFRQGIRQSHATIHRNNSVTTWMSRQAERVGFDEKFESACGEDTFVGVIDPVQGSLNIFPWDGISSGAFVDNGWATCYSEPDHMLYMILSFPDVKVSLYDNFTLQDNDYY